MNKLIFLCCSILLLTCGNPAPDPHAGVLPHDKDNRENVVRDSFSQADRNLIAEAKGRSVETMDYSTLSNRLEFAGGKIHIFNFWRTDCRSCAENIGHLEKILNETGEDKIKLIHINTDPLSARKDVNIFIRQEGLTGEIYQLDETTLPAKNSLISPTTQLPAMYVIDNKQDVKFYYQQEFAYDELKAVLGALIF